MDILKQAEQIKEHIIHIRRDLHAHPELSFEEQRTSARVCEELERLGIPYERLDKHCVVGTLVGGQAAQGGKTLAIRADMDALPIQEEADVPFKSRHPGVMHACGHDGHTAMLLGAAALLKQMQPVLQGTVKLCFQSAEEVGGGARIIVDHLQATGGVDGAIAAHLWADVESGTMAVQPGARMAGVDTFVLKVSGQGGHGSRPDASIDPIKPLCQTVLNISGIPAHHVSPLDTCVVHVGKLEAGTMGNVFPQHASAHGGVRTFHDAVRKRVLKLIKNTAEHTAAAWGATASVTFGPPIPAVQNSPDAVALAQRVLKQTGLFAPRDHEPILASEDFGFFTRTFGGFMCFIGIRNEEKGLTYGQHHPRFGIDEDVLHRGAAFFAAYAQAFLGAQ